MRRIFPEDGSKLERTALLLAGAYIFVLNMPWVASVRQSFFFAGLALATFIAVKKKESPALWPYLLLWAGAAMVSLAATDNLGISISEIKKDILYPVLAFLLCWSVTRTRGDFGFLAAMAALGAAITAGASYYVYFIDGIRFEDLFQTSLLFENRAYFSFHMVSAAIILWAAARGEGGWKKPASIALIGVFLFAVYFARLRAGYLSIVLCAIILILYLNMLGQSFKRKLIVSALTFVILIPLPVVIKSKDLDITVSKGALSSSIDTLMDEERWTIWERSVEVIKESPFIGHGFGRKEFFAAKARPPRVLHPHNIFLSYFVMAGVAGVAALSAVFVKLFSILHSNIVESFRREPFRFGAGLAGVLILAVFISMNLTADIMTRHTGQYFWALMGMAVGATRQDAADSH